MNIIKVIGTLILVITAIQIIRRKRKIKKIYLHAATDNTIPNFKLAQLIKALSVNQNNGA